MKNANQYKGTGPVVRFGPNYPLFPFFEQTALFNAVNELQNPWLNNDASHPITSSISTLRCPSDTYGYAPAVIDNYHQAICNIVVNRGDTTTHDSIRLGNDGEGMLELPFYCLFFVIFL